MSWAVERHRGTADELHQLLVPDDGVRRIWILEPTGPALVLGSTQSEEDVDVAACDRAGIAVVRRRSGGGAVWLAPDDPLWVDIVVPRGDVLWDDDVGRSFLPIGRAWQAALASAGITGTTVHEGPLVRTEWSHAVCFAGTGPGEVVADGAKLVGMSQRRTRSAARFQCAVPRTWDAEPLRGLLRPPPPVGALDACGTGVGAAGTEALVDALVESLG